MIKIENAETYGWEAAIRGMRNPMNSWDKSDSEWLIPLNPLSTEGAFYNIGDKDYTLMFSLSKGGPDHGKFLRMITVTMDVVAPLYWWKEFDTYKVGTVANSCSTMHRIHSKEFTLDDFSIEHLEANELHVFKGLMYRMEANRKLFLASQEKQYWYRMIQLLPSSYNQRRTVQLNYQVLKNIYHARKNHKLDEWHVFCEWIETLPYSELITA